MGPPTQAQREQMRTNMQQMRKLHEQFRAQILGALTPEHRQLLASIAGNLAIADKPDIRAAAKQLDEALSPGEKSAILADAKAMHDQMRAQMQAMRAAHPWPQRSGAPKAREGKREHHAPTAGGILLMVASGHSMMMGHRGGPPGPPHQR